MLTIQYCLLNTIILYANRSEKISQDKNLRKSGTTTIRYVNLRFYVVSYSEHVSCFLSVPLRVKYLLLNFNCFSSINSHCFFSLQASSSMRIFSIQPCNKLFSTLFSTTAQDHNGSIGGAELDALIRDLYIKNNKVKIPLAFKY